MRGEAYLAAHDGVHGVVEFQKIIDHRSAGMHSIGALARLGIARAYELQGETAKAKLAYLDFLTTANFSADVGADTGPRRPIATRTPKIITT